MKINNLIGVSGSINSGKDVTGEMLQYIDASDDPTYHGYSNAFFIPSYEIKKCAEKLKEVVAIIIGCKRSDLEDEVFKNTELPEQWWIYFRNFDNELITQLEYDSLSKNQKNYFTLVKITPRLMLQLLGTEGGRKVVHPDIWVNALFADWKPIGSQLVVMAKGLPVIYYPKWIITDVRFPENEGVAVNKRGGLLIGIKRHFALKQPKYAHLVDKDNPYDIPSEIEELNPKLYKSLTHESEYAMGDHSWCDVVIENNGTLEDLFNNVLNAVKK